jgi:hypothetical protein
MPILPSPERAYAPPLMVASDRSIERFDEPDYHTRRFVVTDVNDLLAAVDEAMAKLDPGWVAKYGLGGKEGGTLIVTRKAPPERGLNCTSVERTTGFEPATPTLARDGAIPGDHDRARSSSTNVLVSARTREFESPRSHRLFSCEFVTMSSRSHKSSGLTQLAMSHACLLDGALTDGVWRSATRRYLPPAPRAPTARS